MNRVGYSDYKEMLEVFRELILKRFRENLISLVLYGSIARGNAKPESDIDLLIIIDRKREKYLESLNEILDVERKLKGMYFYDNLKEKKITPYFSFVILLKEEALENKYIYLDMIEEAIILFDKEGFFEKKLQELKRRLVELGSMKIVKADGSWYWDLKPDLKFGEEFEL